MKSNEDIIKEELGRDIELPDSLSGKNIVKMLKESNAKPEKAKIKILPKALSVAAMFVIITVAVFTVGLRSDFEDVIQTGQTTTVPHTLLNEAQSSDMHTTQTNEETASSAASLKVAKSEKDLKNHFLKMYAENKIDDYIYGGFNYATDILFD
ncbi:MAG: hypothetical protein IKV21_02785, partial [Clostridia bacterium]|nr:hypothetical protein [Clostridia bacterium]